MSELHIITAPSLYLVGGQVVYGDEFQQFLDDHDNPDWLSTTSKPSEMLPEIGGRLCYMSFKKPRPGGNAAYIRHILESGHGSVLEHAVFSFIITGVSRSLTHEIIRHRAGLSPSQLSQRYVDESDVAFVLPPALVPNWAAWKVIEAARADGVKDLDDLPEWNRSVTFTAWREHVVHARNRYSWLSDAISSEMDHVADATARRKAAREAARSVLPNCTETKIMLTGNARAWRNVIEQRGAAGADAEIRRLAFALLGVLQVEAPALFGDYEVKTNEDGVDWIDTPYRKV
jgi:thymidylate synthase (FAD)